MIPSCRNCGKRYWRYRREFPPSGFCSLPCFEASRVRKGPPPVMNASDALTEIRLHRSKIHNTRDLVRWWEGCQECDRLEERYAALLRVEAAQLNERGVA